MPVVPKKWLTVNARAIAATLFIDLACNKLKDDAII
jgi:hypothetical protein